MTKIYNEVVIDMNPESSSYGDVLYEDSFEYDGPMALAGAIDERLKATSGYRSHKWYKGYPIMERENLKTGEYEVWIYNPDATEILSRANLLHTSWATIHSRVDSYAANQSTTSEDVETQLYGEDITTDDFAKDIEYSEISQYYDSSTGTFDRVGFTNYIRTLPGMAGKDISAIMDTMPNMGIGEQDISQAKGQYLSDVYGLQQKLGQQRSQEATSVGMSGVYNPTDTGFGIGGDSFAEGIYSGLSEISPEAQNVYGLGEEKEQQLYDWVKSLQNT